MPPSLWFGDHVCHTGCDGPQGCLDARREVGRFKRVQQARNICARCEVQTDCLLFALTTREPHGVWGGKTERERRKILKEHDPWPPQ